MNLKQILEEQRRQMLEYKWIRSEEAGYDIGEAALLDWVDRFAADFRAWADSLPQDCIFCAHCSCGDTGAICSSPFNKKRLRLIKKLYGSTGPVS